MAIVDDYAGIAAELRRLRIERMRETQPADADRGSEPLILPQHPMRATPAGELLYRRLVSRRRR